MRSNTAFPVSKISRSPIVSDDTFRNTVLRIPDPSSRFSTFNFKTLHVYIASFPPVRFKVKYMARLGATLSIFLSISKKIYRTSHLVKSYLEKEVWLHPVAPQYPTCDPLDERRATRGDALIPTKQHKYSYNQRVTALSALRKFHKIA